YQISINCNGATAVSDGGYYWPGSLSPSIMYWCYQESDTRVLCIIHTHTHTHTHIHTYTHTYTHIHTHIHTHTHTYTVQCSAVQFRVYTRAQVHWSCTHVNGAQAHMRNHMFRCM